MKVVLFIFCVLFISCNETGTFNQKELLPIDSIVFENVDIKTRVTFNRINKLMSASYVSSTRDKVFLYDIVNKLLYDSIVVPPKKLSQNIFIANNEDIYSLNVNSISIISKFGYKEYYYANDSNRGTIMPLYSNFKVLDSSVMLYDIPNYSIPEKKGRELYFTSKLLSLYKIEHDSFVKKKEFGAFPSRYLEHFYYDFYPIAERINNDRVIFAFIDSNILYHYNLLNGESNKIFVNNLDKNVLKDFDIHQIGSYTYAQKYRLSTSRYTKLLYDEKSRNIVLFQALAAPTVKDKIAIFKEKPVVVYVLDEKHNIRSKAFFKNQQDLTFNNSYVYNGKLYIEGKCVQKNTLKMYVYDIM